MTSPVIYAAAYLLLTGQVVAESPPQYVGMECQLPAPPTRHFGPCPPGNLKCSSPKAEARPNASNHITVRWRGSHHPRHHHHR